MVSSKKLLNRINNRKIRKNIGQFASIIIITLLAVCLFVGLYSNAQTLDNRLDLLLTESNYADGIAYGLVTEDIENKLNDITTDTEKRLELEGTVDNLKSKLLITDGLATINKPYTQNYEEGVYITTQFSNDYEVYIGDKISVDVNIYDIKTITIELEVTGLMYHPEGISEDNPISLTYDIFKASINDVFISSMFSTNVYNSILFKGDVEEVREDDTFKDFFVYDTQLFNAELLQLRNDIDQAYQLTYVFPVVFILVSILIIITTISQLIFKERLNIATLKSIGISNKEIYNHYILLTITLCFMGGIVGALIGPVIIPDIMGMKYNLIYFLPSISNVYNLFVIALSILFFIVVSSMVSFGILKKSVNTLPAPLIKNNGSSKLKNSNSKIKSWSLKIAVRNISQNVFRSLMVIIGVGGCGALFITGFGIDDTLDNTIDTDATVNFNSDANITFSEYNNTIEDVIKQTDGVTYYESYFKAAGMILGETFNLTSIYVINDDTQVFNSGDFNGVYISSKTAGLLNIEIGDEITIKLNDEEKTYKIEYTIDTGMTHGVFIPKTKNNFTIEVTNAWIKTTNSKVTDEVLSKYTEIEDVYTNQEFKDYFEELLGPINIIKVTLQVFAVALGVVVLYNLALLNYKERNRDIATLKVLGLTNIEIAKSLIYEMMILAILGGLFGLVLGYPMLVLLLSINEVDYTMFLYALTIKSYIYTLAFTTLTALIINLILYKQINKVKMVESLKSVE